MKTILVLGAGTYFGKTIGRLTKGGYYVIALDRDENAIGKTIANEFYPIDFSDREKVYAFAKERNIDGIMALNEFGVKAAAYTSARLGLFSISEETALNSCDKGYMRDVWKQHQLAIPPYAVITNKDELIKAAETIGFPCVLKPTDSGGSGRGISVLQSEKDLDWAYDFAIPYVHNGRMILEGFVTGTELTVEAFSYKGHVTILTLSDKEKPDLKTRVATSLNYPAALSPGVLEKVETLVSKAVLALGIDNGISHTEVIVTPEGEPFLVETGARGGGGHIFHTIIELVSGVNAPLLQAALVTGEEIHIGPLSHNGCCYRFFNPSRGILKEIRHLDKVGTIAGVVDYGITKKIGEEVGNLENSTHRAGFVVTTGTNREDAIRVANEVENTIEFIVE